MKPLALALALAIAAALLCPAPAQAQEDPVATQLDSIAVLLATPGFQPLQDVVRGTLPSGEDEAFPLEVRAGTRYVIVGVCDRGCTDLDLALVNAAGTEAAADRGWTKVPFVSFEAVEDGRFTVKVEMAACGTGHCEYGVRVFASGG